MIVQTKFSKTDNMLINHQQIANRLIQLKHLYSLNDLYATFSGKGTDKMLMLHCNNLVKTYGVYDVKEMLKDLFKGIAKQKAV